MQWCATGERQGVCKWRPSTTVKEPVSNYEQIQQTPGIQGIEGKLCCPETTMSGNLKWQAIDYPKSKVWSNLTKHYLSPVRTPCLHEDRPRFHGWSREMIPVSSVCSWWQLGQNGIMGNPNRWCQKTSYHVWKMSFHYHSLQNHHQPLG